MAINESTTVTSVLFDLDGTLLDTATDFFGAINRLRKEEGLPDGDYKSIRYTASNGAAALIDLNFQVTRNSSKFEELQRRLLSHYEQHIADTTQLFKGLDTLLDWLESQAMPWGVVTNKPERFTTPLLKKLQLHHRCATIICPDHVTHTKPHPEPLLLACHQVSSPPSETVYIGDHSRDIVAGQRAGMRTIAALYGYLSPEDKPEKWNATFSATSPDEILEWLQQQNS
ncbi:HAD family hydrolase [Motiliproteus sp. MSK22-1]|uniref:HAD family hydrolase n=1 Tax=Motiliproteus sp. MSK22-1 TaxID=1897630 RepID=UPI00097724D5|nr:HAD-IA family hydrolase [Motiliproteus sp. MSK22-1]OMH30909.1 hypothetical protein BGP75_00815 [Motiliproteus sp. MSK22-1]